MVEKKPLVSIIMPFYDDGSRETRKYFSLAVESIMHQTFCNFELVVVVSGHKDYAKRLSSGNSKMRVLYCGTEGGYDQGIKNKVNGLAMARNCGVNDSKGELIAFADADDISVPRRIEIQVAKMLAAPSIGVLGSGLETIDEGGKTIGHRVAIVGDQKIKSGMVLFNTVYQPSVMIRKKLIVDVGGYREIIAEDYDLWVRLLNKTRFENIPTPLIKYRIHSKSGVIRYRTQIILGTMKTKADAARKLGRTMSLHETAINYLQILSVIAAIVIGERNFEKHARPLVYGLLAGGKI